MTEPGYIDYARTSLATGFLLAGGAQPFNAGDTILFQGYIGPFPYINFFWNAIGGASHQQVKIFFFSDNTFATSVAFSISVRTTNIIGYRQFAAISPWVQIRVTSDANDATVAEYAFYGTTQKATSAKLGSLDAIFLETFPTVAANNVATLGPNKVYPGLCSVSVFTKVATAQFDLQRWDYSSASWQTFWLTSLLAVNASATLQLGLPDAPIQIELHNLTGAAGSLGAWMMPVMD
jgi:hypothetical protein